MDTYTYTIFDCKAGCLTNFLSFSGRPTYKSKFFFAVKLFLILFTGSRLLAAAERQFIKCIPEVQLDLIGLLPRYFLSEKNRMRTTSQSKKLV